jgi:hypothetical protein
MLIAGQEALVRAANRANLLGTPFESLAEYYRRLAAEEAAAKVVSIAEMRAKLRPVTITAES